MLSKPSVGDLEGKFGNRYEVSLAVAKRARQIAKKRLEEGSENISDTVDVASKEFEEGKTVMEINKSEDLV